MNPAKVLCSIMCFDVFINNPLVIRKTLKILEKNCGTLINSVMAKNLAIGKMGNVICYFNGLFTKY